MNIFISCIFLFYLHFFSWKNNKKKIPLSSTPTYNLLFFFFNSMSSSSNIRKEKDTTNNKNKKLINVDKIENDEDEKLINVDEIDNILLYEDYMNISPEVLDSFAVLDIFNNSQLTDNQIETLLLVSKYLALPLLQKMNKLERKIEFMNNNYDKIAEDIFENNYTYISKLIEDKIMEKIDLSLLIDNIEINLTNNSKVKNIIENNIKDYLSNVNNILNIIDKVKMNISENLNIEDILTEEEIMNLVEKLKEKINDEVLHNTESYIEEYEDEINIF